MNLRLIAVGIFALVGAGCLGVSPEFAEGDYRPRERGRSACTDELMSEVTAKWMFNQRALSTRAFGKL